MSKGTAEALEVSGHKVKIMEAGKQYQVGGWSVVPFPVVHDAAEPLGFILARGKSKWLFATDTAYIVNQFRGLTHIAVECNYNPEILIARCASGIITKTMLDRLTFSHFGLDNVLEFLSKNDLSLVREIHLLHLSDSSSDEKLMKKTIEAATGIPVFVAKK